MNSNRLTLKDYFIIYFIIVLIATFLGGFFLGARVMENRITASQQTFASNKVTVKQKKDEILTFYDKIFEPTRELNKELFDLIQSNQMDEKIAIQYIDHSRLLKENLLYENFQSQYLKTALLNSIGNLELTAQSLKDSDYNMFINDAFQTYLTSQKEFYRDVWIWDQSVSSNKVNTETLTTWDEWNEAPLAQKNYIVAIILDKKKIRTLSRPEDITVHIDAYLKANKETRLDLTEVVNLLVKSDSVIENDYIKYQDWYKDDNLIQLRILK